MTASRSGAVVTIQTNSPADPDEVEMLLRSGSLTFLGGQFGTNTDVNAGSRCTDTPSADDAQCGVGVTRVVVRPGAGDDRFTTRSFGASDSEDRNAVVDADTGPGEDLLSVSENTQRVECAGDDGSDSAFSGPAADRLDGAAGSAATSSAAARTATRPV